MMRRKHINRPLSIALGVLLAAVSAVPVFGAVDQRECTGSVTTNDTVYSADFREIDTLNIIADGSAKDHGGCNITVMLCDHEDLLVEYRDSVHKVSVQQEGSTATLHLSGKEKAVVNVMNRIVLHLPRKSYKHVSVEAIKSGINLPPMNADLTLTNDKGAMSIELPKQYTKTMNYTGDKGAGSLMLSPQATNFTLNVKADASGISLAKDMPSYRYGSNYQFVSGSGEGVINIDIKHAAFSVSRGKETHR